MFAQTSPLRTAQRAVSRAAMAVALCTGMAVTATAVAPSAYAQAEKELSRDFRKALQPMAKLIQKGQTDEPTKAIIAQIKQSDDASKPALRAQLRQSLAGVDGAMSAMVNAAKSADEVYTAGQYILNYGLMLGDIEVQSRGLKMSLDSGQTEPARIGQFAYIVGAVAFNKGDNAGVRKYVPMAINAGYRENPDLMLMLMEAYTRDNMAGEAVAMLNTMADRYPSDNGLISESSIRHTLKTVYDAGDLYNTGEMLLLLDDRYPSEETSTYMSALPRQIEPANLIADAQKLVTTANDPRAWAIAVSAVVSNTSLSERGALDAMRLLARTDSLTSDRDYRDYLVGVDAIRNPTEADTILNRALSAGRLAGADAFLSEIRQQISQNRNSDKSYVADRSVLSKARAGGRVQSKAAGNTAFSLGDYALAEELLTIAAASGDADADQLLLRLGIAQVEQGKIAAGKETLGRVQGEQAYIAGLWSAYADLKSQPAAPAAPATDDGMDAS